MKNIILFTFIAFVVSSSTITTRLLDTASGTQQTEPWYDKCKNWDAQNMTCLQCRQGSQKWENICLRIVKYCSQWDSLGNCTTCQSGYGDANNNSVDGKCPQQIKNNNTSNTPDKTNTVGGQPNPIQAVDQNCQCHDDNRTCIYCFAGYYLDLTNFCLEVPQNCTSADQNGACTACVSGFKVQNEQCVKQQCNLGLCATFNIDQTACTSCPSRSYLQSGCCIQVNGYCSNWVQNTGQCTQCYAGYRINPNNSKECIAQTN